MANSWPVYGDGQYILHPIKNVSLLSGHGAAEWLAVEDENGAWCGFVEPDGTLFCVVTKDIRVLDLCFPQRVTEMAKQGLGRVVRLACVRVLPLVVQELPI